MRFYTQTHRHYCGIDLHAKNKAMNDKVDAFKIAAVLRGGNLPQA